MPRRDRTRDPVPDDSLQQSCPLCRLPDSNDMVSCDDCERWFHFDCAGVNEDVANHNWSCQECIVARVPAPQSPHPRTPTGDPLPHPQSPIPLPVPRLPTPQTPIPPVPTPRPQTPRTPIVPPRSPLPNPQPPTPRPRTPRSPNPPPPTPRLRTPRTPNVNPDVPVVPRQVAVDPDFVNKLPAELRIQLLEEEQAIERKFMLRRFQLLLESTGNAIPARQSSPEGNAFEPNNTRNHPVFHSSPVNSHRRYMPPFAPPPVRQDHDGPTFAPHREQQQLYVPVDIPSEINHRPDFSARDPPRIDHHSNIPAFNPPPPIHRPIASTFASLRTDQHQHIPTFSQANHTQRPNASAFAPYAGLPRPAAQEYYPYDLHDYPSATGGTALLNKSQIAARHAVSKELPIFSGEPDEWPLFFATYENTTNLCGFSAEENMARLQKCLRGKALEAVKCQLLHPANLDQVISTLRMLFGRPEIIVHSLLQKINTLPAPKAERLGTLVDFALAVRNMVATVKACELEEHLCNLTLLHNLVDRLPPMIRLNWATHRQSLRSVTLLEFSEWLYKLAEAASTVTMPQFSGSFDNKTHRERKNDGFLNAHTETVPKVNQSDVDSGCVICNSNCIAVEKCKQFVAMDLSARWAALREHKLCRSCLESHRGPCKSGKSCGKNGCQYKHHRMMHNDAKDKSIASSSSSSTPTTSTSQHVSASSSRETRSCNTHRGESRAVLFQYVPITLYNDGIKVQTYAFLDSGSSLTLMEESLAKELNLRGERHPLCLRWTADTCRYEDDAMRVSFNVSGLYDGCPQNKLTDVYTVKELKLPSQSLSMRMLSTKYPHLDGLPIEPYSNVQPKILIGMNNVRVIHPLDSREGKPNEPAAVKTRLGWTIYGTCLSDNDPASKITPYSYHICFHSYDSDELLHETVKNYFTLDSLGISAPQNQLLSKEDERALTKLRDVTTFQNGRYQVGLLWKYDDVRLPNNRSMVLRRHHCLVKRMEREPQLAETLRAKMADYISKGYVRKLTPEESQRMGNRTWYLPIFPVFNPNKPGKVRIVFDAAASFGGVSLNSVLMKGPDQLNALPPVLLKFRERLIGLGGDVAEMFHQMLMNPQDEDSQRIVWCADGTMDPCDYVMQVVTFGATCSPSTALFVLNENAARFESEYPIAVDAIRHRHYVDDMLTSVDTEEEAINLANEVRYIHQQGGFHMRNWVSNSYKVLEVLGEKPNPEKSLEMSADLAMEKVLGMWWSTTKDVFRYKLCTERNKDLLTGIKHPTKRDMLRTLMAIYDPLGLIAHYLMFLKILLQEVWRAKTGWDEEIGKKELEKWYTWLRILPELESVEIPRCYYRADSSIDEARIELHTFVDASELGYAAVSYFRFERDGHVHCALVGSKTRVAPLKFVSIPRLELQAAVIGMRLAKSIEAGHSVKVDRRYFWTDARDVMCWLQSDHRRYSQFVAFRVGEILEETNVTEWKWIGTKENVADDGTKWRYKPDLKPACRWFNGPSFLWRPKIEWLESSLNGQETVEEIRSSVLHHSVGRVRTILLPENFSSWYRIRRVTAFVQRFVNNIWLKKGGQQRSVGPLTQQELLEAEAFQIKRAQEEVYADELAVLAAGDRRLQKKNSLFKVSPFIDKQGVMRIHSRLGECDFIDESSRYPIVLPREHPVTTLVIRDVHLRYHHQCHETCVNEVRKGFHIPRVRRVYDRVRRECQLCKLQHAAPAPPMMAPLPKRWGVIVTCLTIRAIHLELAATLNTSSCILALRNCFARRGTPVEIRSDRGTNFVGADKELKEALAALDQNRFMAEFTTPRTTWCFNPPAAPHMGGCWERLIRSVKKVLSQVKPQRVPTEEILRSYLIEVENIINSRPLTQVPVDDYSSPALTPNHFLLGSSDGSKPLVPYDECPLMLQRSWKASQALANLFWKRWVDEYLPTITRRTKWHYPVRPIAVGEIVVVADPSLPRNCWPKGRVVSVKTSADGQIRSAAVQTTTGLYERPATKLAVLDVGVNESGSDQGPTTGGDCCVRPSCDATPTNLSYGCSGAALKLTAA
ncbi:uncharacterized protein LOC135707298 [Ochlerotatus camptorhynchus]|uniref:uncharacterized protein LOC135707298 n=1 Tax=Ochlerotatus camptorhynchus TaxID=644619 RepID=UPI0031E0B3B8